ncbi:MAG: hypothetical protein NC177_02925 [Ruminococcus flavefaciens]|nr:hypothetical protein [Ruminococcus flavefaciens]
MISDFIAGLNNIDWFSKSGTPTNKYHVIYSVFEAFDDYSEKYFKVWDCHITKLEREAQAIIGDEKIDNIFSLVSSEMGDKLWTKWSAFIERNDLYDETGLENEILDMVKRDLAWACIEKYLQKDGFFSDLMHIYQDGYFPCAWDGIYPKGMAVVL